MKRRLILWCTFAVLLAAPCMRAVAADDDQPTPQDREKAMKMMETVIYWRMVDGLNLTEDQTARFTPKFREIRDCLKQQKEYRMKVTADLKDLLKKEKTPEKEIEAKINDLEKHQDEAIEKMQKLRADMRKILTPEQQAKFVIAQENVAREITERLRNKVNERRPGLLIPRGKRQGARQGTPSEPQAVPEVF